jgi:hypothetical protein
VHSLESIDRRMAGIAALDGLIEVPSADEEKKAIKFANTAFVCPRELRVSVRYRQSSWPYGQKEC